MRCSCRDELVEVFRTVDYLLVRLITVYEYYYLGILLHSVVLGNSDMSEISIDNVCVTEKSRPLNPCQLVSFSLYENPRGFECRWMNRKGIQEMTVWVTCGQVVEERLV